MEMTKNEKRMIIAFCVIFAVLWGVFIPTCIMTYGDRTNDNMESIDRNYLYELGLKYEEGKGVESDLLKAKDYYEKAAENGYIPAQNRLAHWYLEGVLEKNDDKALYWSTQSANQNDAEGMALLGKCYYEGIGVGADYDKAFVYFNRAAERGNATAQYMLGKCYENGAGVEKDYRKANMWFSRAVENGYLDH